MTNTRKDAVWLTVDAAARNFNHYHYDVKDTKYEYLYTETVTIYDNHCFLTPVLYAPYALKKRDNVLGYVKIDRPTILEHNEHVNILLQPGRYTVRQCRSWEANPNGVWSLRID